MSQTVIAVAEVAMAIFYSLCPRREPCLNPKIQQLA